MPSLGKRCLLHYSMYLAGACLSLSLHVCVLHVLSSGNSRYFVCLFEAVPRKSPHNAQATGRARCAQNDARTQRPHKHKTRCSIPPGASLSWRCPVPSLIGLAYIQRQRPDSSTAQTCHSALIWPAYIHRAIPDSSTALRYNSSRRYWLGNSSKLPISDQTSLRHTAS